MQSADASGAADRGRGSPDRDPGASHSDPGASHSSPGASHSSPGAAHSSPGAPDRAPTAAELAAKDAAADSLARARAVARGKGLRPGSKPTRRRAKDLPADARRATSGRDFTTLGDQVRHLIDERGWDVDVAAGSVMGRWPQIVGPEVAAHSQPVHFELGVLTVRADSTSWATQLRLLSSTLMGRLAHEAGEGVVTELKVVGPSARSWVRGPRKVSDGRGPRDTYG